MSPSGVRSTQDGDIVFRVFVLSSVGDLSGALDSNKLNKALSRLEDMAFVDEQTQALRPPTLGWWQITRQLGLYHRLREREHLSIPQTLKKLEWKELKPKTTALPQDGFISIAALCQQSTGKCGTLDTWSDSSDKLKTGREPQQTVFQLGHKEMADPGIHLT